MIYGIDSHTFIWAVKKQAEPHDRHKLREAEKLMEWFKASKHQVLVPTVVLAECLIREPEDRHSAILAEAYKRFIVADFDGRCALKYGQLLRLENWVAANQLRTLNSIRREKMKLDHMIVACALVNGANGIFTEDDELIKFASPHIKTLPTSNLPDQTELFAEEAPV